MSIYTHGHCIQDKLLAFTEEDDEIQDCITVQYCTVQYCMNNYLVCLCKISCALSIGKYKLI